MKKILRSALIAVTLVAMIAGCGKTKVAPMPLISRGAPAYTNDTGKDAKLPSLANNAGYGDAWRSSGTPSPKKPIWLAYDLSGAPAPARIKALLVWYNEDTSPYDHTLITAIKNPGYNNVGSYTIDANPAPGGKVPETGWVTLVTVAKNRFHSRQHVLDFNGFNWVRLSAASADGTKDNMNVSFNMDVYGPSKGTQDDWIFIGDSITQMAMHHNPMACKAGSGSFSRLINASCPSNFPVQENGGTGYMTSADGAKHINEWIVMFPGRYVALSYGTNDAWNGMKPEEFYNNYSIMAGAVLKAGKIPLIPSIPWSFSQEKIQKNGVELNRQIERLCSAYPQIIKGPDFWNFYRGRPDLLSKDGVHPSWPDGLFMYRKMWADTALNKIYK